MALLDLSPAAVSDALIENFCNKENPNNKRARIMKEAGKIIEDELENLSESIRKKGISTFCTMSYINVYGLFIYSYVFLFIFFFTH
jgi:hypothetical protein